MPADTGEQTTPSGATSWMASAAILMVFATFMSGLTGLLRDVAIGARFGREGADAFFNASSIPDLLYFLVAGGALGGRPTGRLGNLILNIEMPLPGWNAVIFALHRFELTGRQTWRCCWVLIQAGPIQMRF